MEILPGFAFVRSDPEEVVFITSALCSSTSKVEVLAGAVVIAAEAIWVVEIET